MEKTFILSMIEVGSKREVLNSLKEIPNVKEVHEIYGVYDLIIYVEAETMQELKDLIDNRIRGIGKIRSAMPLVCIEKKRSILW